MDAPERTRDFKSPLILQTSASLSNHLIEYWNKHHSPPSRICQSLGREIEAFHATYQAVRPLVHSRLGLISHYGIDLIRDIHDGIEAICDDIWSEVAELDKTLANASKAQRRRTWGLFALQGDKPEARECEKRMKDFLEKRGCYSLERAQLRYANHVLSLILIVVV